MDTRSLQNRRRPPGETISPMDETVRALRTWPDGELWDLAQAVGCELLRRQLPTHVALPVVEAVAGLGERCQV